MANPALIPSLSSAPLSRVPMPDLVELLAAQPVSCRLWPEQTEGPYDRPVHPERRDITEGRVGLALRVGLRLVDARSGAPLVGVPVEVWHADHDGRYAGFAPFTPRPGEFVTSASVPNEVVAPSETFLRGMQRTDEEGISVFETIYPGWYASRTVHIHVAARLPTGRRAVSQLYFPDEVTDQVFARPPYAGRPPRDTTNATDSIFADGGARTVLRLTGDPVDGLTGVLCMAIEPNSAPPDTATPVAEYD
jgi:protocatechuate 3,4-dioxygenase beta subunit